MNTQIYKQIIIGSGPAGLTAAIYSARANLNPLVLAGINPGGQLMITGEVENFPGFENGITGPDLMQKMINQATRFGAEIKNENVDSVDFSKTPYVIKSGDNIYLANTVIIATGAKSKWLNVENEENLIGKGVSSCATCDAAFFKNKRVAIVGGGDSACEEALFLTHFASEVVLIHRRNELRASKIMVERVMSNPKIKIYWNTFVEKLIGTKKLESVVLNKEGIEVSENFNGLFVAIGHEPNTIIFKGQIDTDVKGYINPVEGTNVKTNLDGIFVCGDVSDFRYRQAIVAAGHGCMASMEAESYLSGSSNKKLVM